MKPLKPTKSAKPMKMVNTIFLSPFVYINPLLPATAMTGSPSPSEVNQRGWSSDQPIEGPQKGLKVPILVNFEAKMVIIAILDYSAVSNSGIRKVMFFSCNF